MDDTTASAFLGTGWSFPPTFLAPSGGVRMVSGVDDIQQSLGILFTTTVRERLLHPTYGCDLRRYLFEPLNASVTARIQSLVRTAILYHEPRITPEAVTVAEVAGEGMLRIQVDYTIRASNARHNFVFPFYRDEPSATGP
ncbi:MAG: GPW/gp25 family protein [Verrucomicrobiales bacterium]|nr:GPW/gp25 family protein [Verrucomicrobiales bacterium]MCP5527852.1 GPW/gp25 family protein [Verrucomicrobiales bacterium]